MADGQYSSFWRMGRRSSPDVRSTHGRDGERDDDSLPRKKRIHYSCDECHRRKQKCNRQQPCQHCCARGVPQRCRFSTANLTTAPASPGAHSSATTMPSDFADLKQTMQDGFAEVLQAVRGVPSGLGPSKQSGSGSRHGHMGDDEEQDLVFLPPTTVSSTRGSRLLDMLSVNTAAAVLDPTRSLDEHSSIDHALYELSLRDTQRNGPLSQSLLCCLPPPDEVQVLFDGYVEDMNALRYPFVLEPIRRCMNRIPDMLQRGYIATDEVSSFAVVAAMLSQAVLRTERHDIVPRDITTIYMGARKLVFACMKALCVSDILGRMDFEKCLALHLAARFLLVDRRINEAWVSAGNAVRCAQSIGLHRYESIDRPHREAEESRVLWCSLRYDERSFSVMLDRPSSIDDNLCTTRPPPASATLATEDAEFVGWRHELATFQGRILSLLQGSPKGVSIREVLSLDEEIAEFRRTLPGDDTNDRNRFVQRFVIHSHTLQARTALLRPFFLRTIPRNAPQQVRQRHLACRRRCVEAACEDLALREYLVKEIGTIYGDGKVPSPARNHIRTPRWFTTLVICGAYLLTCNPHLIDGEASEDASMAQKAREHLQTFIGLAEEKQRSETSRDAALDREVSIVSMFLEKSSIANPQNENGKRARDRTASVHGSAVSHGTPTAHSTPGRPIANGDSGSNRASSDVGRQGEDLQVIFDAWFQSDFNNINANDIPSVFEVPSTAAISALPTSAPSMPGPTVAMVQQQHQQQQQGHRQERQQQQVQMQEQPNLMSPSQNQNGMQGGEFWQGFINMLSTQSGL